MREDRLRFEDPIVPALLLEIESSSERAGDPGRETSRRGCTPARRQYREVVTTPLTRRGVTYSPYSACAGAGALIRGVSDDSALDILELTL